MTPRASTIAGWWNATLATWFAWVSLSAGVAHGEPPIAYRRVLVPAESPASWPRGEDSHLPVEARDFDSWVAAANEPPSTATIAEAEYDARVVENELTDGHARWQVVLQGERPARMPLRTTSMTLQNARWSGESAAAARLGWWPAADGQGLLYALEVPHSDELKLDWHATGTPTATGALEFALHLPIAARTRLALDVPEGKRPVIEGGVAIESPAQPAEGGRWVLALGPTNADVLRLEDFNPRTTPQTISTTVRQKLSYEVTNSGIELKAELRLETRGQPLKRLGVSLPAGMQLIEATSGSHSLTWRITAAAESGGPARATIELPPSAARSSPVVSLRAWAPLEVDSPLRLPTLVVDDAFWSSGTIELALDDALEISELQPIDCIQTTAAMDTVAGDAVRRLQFAAYTPSATVDLALAHRPSTGLVRMGTALEIGNPGVAGRLIADVSVERGSLHKLTAELAPGWSMDAVETNPASALGEWYVDRSHEPHTFEVQLDRAVSRERPVRLIVTGRLERSASQEPLAVAGFNPLRWQNLQVVRNLVQLRAAEQFELETVGEFPGDAADRYAEADRRLFTTPAAGRLFDLAATPSASAVRLVPKKGEYDATIQLNVALNRERLRQTYRIECRPHGSGIDHVLAFFSEPPAAPLEWTDAESKEPLLAERMPATDPRLGGLPPGGELWLLHLRRLYARPITITATGTTPWPERRRVPLISLPDASAEQGRVTIASAGSELPTIVAERMSPTPMPVGKLVDEMALEPGETVRGVYRYRPTRLYDSSPAADLWLGPASASALGAGLVATRVEVDSHYLADGIGTHHVSYQLENLGATSLTLTLPAETRFESATLDGQSIFVSGPDRLKIQLSSERSNSELQLELTSRGAMLAVGSRLSSPLPQGQIALLDGRWRVSLPQGFAAIGGDESPGNASISWRERLFGPLARHEDQLPFRPQSADDWNTLWSKVARFLSTPAQAAAAMQQDEPLMPTGWQTSSFTFIGEPPATITLDHRPATTAVALAIFLLATASAVLCGARWAPLLIASLAAAGVSLVMPALYAPLATSVTLGLAAAALWRWSQVVVAKRRTAIVALATLLALAPHSVRAELPQAVESVLVPIDADGKTAGTKYYVTSDFLRRLMGAADRRSAADSWLLTEMRCDGELVPSAEHDGLSAGKWALTCELETFTRDGALSLPLTKQDADWNRTASLDGMPAAIAWNESGRECTIQIAEPGHHRLSIPFVPQLQEEGGRQRLALRLPPVACSAVRVVTPATVVDLDTQETYIPSRSEASRTTWQGLLGPTGQFTASWLASQTAATATANGHVEELRWLHVRPDGLALDVIFTLRSGAEWPESIDVAADPEWKLAAEQQDADVGKPANLPDGRQLFQLRTTPASNDGRQIVLHFRARDSHALGRIRLPDVGLTSMNVESRWLAVSCDSTLECVPSSAVAADPNPPVDVTSDWQKSGEPAPQLFINTAKLEAGWYLAVRPRAEPSPCQDRLSLAAGRNGVRVDYRAEITPHGADCFSWSVNVPADLRVENVTIKEGEDLVPVDFVRTSSNQVTAFFARSISKPYRFQLEGSLPLAADGRLALPRIGHLGQSPSAQVVALYRDEDVLARWDFPGAAPWVESGASPTPPFGPLARFVRAYSVDTLAAHAVSIAVEANEPLVEGNTLTTITHTNGIWAATFACDLRVTRGELVAVRLRVPANWKGPFEIAPATKTELAAATANEHGTATLSVELPQPARSGDSVTLELRSPLTVADGELPTAPQISLLAAGERKNYLSLPRTLEGENVVWTHKGIEPAKLPRGLEPAAPELRDNETFRMAGESINVALLPRATRAKSASVAVAETTIHLGPAGGKYSVARFIIVPEGLDQCVIKLPEGERFVEAALDGHPALVRALDPRRWQVQLGPPSLPQMLDVVSRSIELDDGLSPQIELVRPVLEQSGQPIPIDLNLWTLWCERASGTPRVTGGTLVTPGELAATRLDRMASLSQSTTRSVIESPVVDGYGWFSRWAAELDAAKQAARSLESMPAATATVRVPQATDSRTSDAIGRCDAWVEQIAEMFATTELAISRDRPAETRAINPWREAGAGSGDSVCLISDGSQERAVVDLIPDGFTVLETRWAGLASLAFLAAAVVWLVRTPPVLRVVEDWPEALALVLGLGAWLWLRPSVVGLAIAAFSLVLVVRRLLAERKSPRHDSSNQPSSIPEDSAKH